MKLERIRGKRTGPARPRRRRAGWLLALATVPALMAQHGRAEDPHAMPGHAPAGPASPPAASPAPAANGSPASPTAPNPGAAAAGPAEPVSPLAASASAAGGPAAASPPVPPPERPLFVNPPLLQPVPAAGRPIAELRLKAAGTALIESLQPEGTPEIGCHAAEIGKDRPPCDYKLMVRFTSGTIWNPATGRADQVSLRSYVGSDVRPEPGTDPAKVAPFLAPRIEAKPGDTITITLDNQLPPDPSCTEHESDPDVPHCFNGTNLHSHGLWVSPSGNGDNVLLSINPGVKFQYIYNIPLDHPAGTFWYHPHRHGSTALQVSSGMAGAFIIRGDRLPTRTANGDLDVLTRGMQEQVVVLQQIQYACLDAQGRVKVLKDNAGTVVSWVCDPGDIGVVDKYAYPTSSDPDAQGFGPGTWNASGRFTTINGVVRPRFTAKAGEPQRWRLIHAGVRDTITLGFRRRKAGTPPLSGVTAQEAKNYIEQNCDSERLPYDVVAADGLTMAKAHEVTSATLQPGYRYDALVVFPEPGEYCVVNEAAPAAGSVSREQSQVQLLSTVEVAPSDTSKPARFDPSEVLRVKLVAKAEAVLKDDPAILTRVRDDLNDGLKFTKFTPHPDVEDREVTGHQALTFFIDTTKTPAAFEVGDRRIYPEHFDAQAYEPKPYDPNRVDRHLRLGGVDEWILQSAFVSHPFHIHVNPFQIVSIIDPWGRDVSKSDVPDDGGSDHKMPLDKQYAGLSGVWKDTLWVKDLINNPGDYPLKLKDAMYTITIRTRYERYIGEFVLHCHILDHEDQGMMQNVSIEMSDGAGGLAGTHH